MAEPSAQQAVLGSQVLDRFALSVTDPGADEQNEELKLRGERHGRRTLPADGAPSRAIPAAIRRDPRVRQYGVQEAERREQDAKPINEETVPEKSCQPMLRHRRAIRSVSTSLSRSFPRRTTSADSRATSVPEPIGRDTSEVARFGPSGSSPSSASASS